MDELRPEIRAAFEKEQDAYPPVAALRRTIAAAAIEQRRPSRNLQWMAVAAAAILAILVVAGLMATRIALRGAAPLPAAPKADYGPPPPGVNLLYVHDPHHLAWLIGYDWQGQPRGTVKLDRPLPTVGMAPDGQSFWDGSAAKGGTGQLLDRLGRPLTSVGLIPDKAGPVWADDNRHLCGVSFDLQTFVWTFVTVLPGEAVKDVAVIAREPSGGGQTGIRVVSCSFSNNQALLVRTTVAWPAEMWAVRISDGKVLSHSTYLYSEPGLLAGVVASLDSAFIAENSIQSTGQTAPGASKTIIRRVSDMSVVVTLDPSLGVLAFSGNDSLVLVTTSPWFGDRPVHLAVMDLSSGRVQWRYDGPEGLGTFLAEPGGTGIALTLKIVPTQPSPCGTTPQTACRAVAPDQLSDILIVHGDGSTTTISGRYAPTW